MNTQAKPIWNEILLYLFLMPLLFFLGYFMFWILMKK